MAVRSSGRAQEARPRISLIRHRLSLDKGRVSTMSTRSPTCASFRSSCALKRVDRLTTRSYCGWRKERSTRTTRVLFILSLTTSPTRLFSTPRPPRLYPRRSPRARSRRSVCTRASSRRACPMRAGFFAIAIETLNRRLKTSSRSSRAFCPSSPSLRSRSFAFPFIARLAYRSRVVTLDHLRPDGQLLPRQAKCLARDVLGQPLHLVQDAARLHDRDPVLGVALALPHARLG